MGRIKRIIIRFLTGIILLACLAVTLKYHALKDQEEWLEIGRTEYAGEPIVFYWAENDSYTSRLYYQWGNRDFNTGGISMENSSYLYIDMLSNQILIQNEEQIFPDEVIDVEKEGFHDISIYYLDLNEETEIHSEQDQISLITYRTNVDGSVSHVSSKVEIEKFNQLFEQWERIDKPDVEEWENYFQLKEGWLTYSLGMLSYQSTLYQRGIVDEETWLICRDYGEFFQLNLQQIEQLQRLINETKEE